MAASLYGCLIVPAAAAEETAGAGHVPMNSMNLTEYESYREQLDRQLRHVTESTPQQNTTSTTQTAGQSAEETANSAAGKSGYGKGYRARMETRGGAGRAGGFRGSSMSRGGGRNR